MDNESADYKAIKRLLQSRRRDIDGFTFGFYKIYVTDRKRGIYSGVKSTEFYNKNSGAYCEFLEIYNEYIKGEIK